MSDVPQDWTVALSGPLATRASLLAGLATAGVEVDWPADMHHGHGLPDAHEPVTRHVPAPDGSVDDNGEPAMVEAVETIGKDDPTIGWILARHPNVNGFADEPTRAGWTLRMHWPTPRCGACNGHGRFNDQDCAHCQGRGRTPLPYQPERS